MKLPEKLSKKTRLSEENTVLVLSVKNFRQKSAIIIALYEKSCISYELSTCLALRKYSRWSSLKSSSLLGKSLTLNTNFLIPAILFITRVGVQFRDGPDMRPGHLYQDIRLFTGYPVSGQKSRSSLSLAFI